MTDNIGTIPTLPITNNQQVLDPSAPNSTQNSDLDGPTTIPDTTQESGVAINLKWLQEAKENLRNASKDDPDLASKILAVAGRQGDYILATNTKDEGAILEALEMAATAEGMTLWCEYNHGRATYIQMMLCYVAFRVFNDKDWLLRGIDFGIDSAKILSDHRDGWIYGSDIADYRTNYSARCEQVAYGYRTLYNYEKRYDHQINRDTITAALVCQGKATDWTDPEDGVEAGLAEWDRKFNRHSEWVNMWLQVSRETPNMSLVDPINFTNGTYPQDMRGPTSYKGAYRLVFYLMCRQWAVTRDRVCFEDLLQRAREIMGWNSETQNYGSLLDKKWCQDPNNQRHVLRVAGKIFNHYYQVFDEEYTEFDDLSTTNTSIALLEEFYEGLKRGALNIEDLEERAYVASELCILYGRKYGLTEVVTDGWRYDDLLLEQCAIFAWLKTLKSQSLSLDVPVEPSTRAHTCITGLVGVVTLQDFKFYTRAGQMDFAWTSFRLKFLRDNEGPPKPPAAEAWISGRTNDGRWTIGPPLKGRDDDVLEFIRNYQQENTAE